MRRRPHLLIGVAIALLVVFVGVGFLSNDRFVVLERGELLFHTSEEVERVRAFDRVTFYAPADIDPTFDDVNGLLLFGGASVALFVAVALGRAGPTRVWWFFFCAWLGVGFLAVDELYSLHETAGHNLSFLADLPGVKHPDDVVLLSYALPAGLFVYAFRDVLRASRRTTALLGSVLALYVLAVLLDLAALDVEDQLEIVASGLLVAALGNLALEQLGSGADVGARHRVD